MLRMPTVLIQWPGRSLEGRAPHEHGGHKGCPSPGAAAAASGPALAARARQGYKPGRRVRTTKLWNSRAWSCLSDHTELVWLGPSAF